MDVTDCLNNCKDKSEDKSIKEPLAVHNESGFSNSNHRRAGSTGTTSTGTSESFTTTDDEAEIDSHQINGHNQATTATICQLFSQSATASDNDNDTIISPTNSNNSDYSDLETDLLEADDNQTAQFYDLDQLRIELRKARESILRKDEELEKLGKIRQDVASELEDLTASLFQEAHNMVRVANERQAAAEKALRESDLKVDLLSAEVSALKTLVLTSTPSAPNKHLHPQIDLQPSHKHRRCSSTSHFNLNYGRETSPSDCKSTELSSSPIKDKLKVQRSLNTSCLQHQFSVGGFSGDLMDLEVDPVLHEEFLDWKKDARLDKDGSAFMRRICREDIDLCLQFANKELSAKVVECVENGSILIEAIGDKSKTMFPKKCALMEVQRHCHYRMNIGPGPSQADSVDTWHFISMICRNRIIAVCDFLNYLKYIERGLVKSTVHDIYWEIVKLRKDMMMARLGLVQHSAH